MNYWENRYKNGGNSGKGSRSVHKEFKWNVLDRHVGNIDDYFYIFENMGFHCKIIEQSPYDKVGALYVFEKS